MFVYIIYTNVSFEVIDVFLSEDECITAYINYCNKDEYSWKAINIDYAFKLIMDMLA